MKLLLLGDLHFRLSNPRNRLDSYVDAFKCKMTQVFDYANKNYVDAILCPGDFFDTPQPSYSTLIEFVDLIANTPVRILGALGNHDCINIETRRHTALNIATQLCFLGALHVGYQDTVLLDNNICLHFRSYTHYIDDPEKKSYQIRKAPGLNILIAHGMILPEPAPFTHTLVENVETDADVVLCGHYHLPFIKKHNGTLFINPGSLMRSSAGSGDMNRTPQFVVLDTETLEYEIVQLQAAPGYEVLDRTELDEKKEQEAAMSEFVELAKAQIDLTEFNIMEVIESVSKLKNVPQNIKEKAVELIKMELK